MVTCKVKHLQNICKNVLEPSTSRRYAVDAECFVLHVTTSKIFLTNVLHTNVLFYTQPPQHVLNVLKHLPKCFENVLPHFCKCFSVKHLQNILDLVTCKINTKTFLQMFCKCLILHATISYLQHVFNVLKHLQTCFENVLQHFCKCFSVKHLQIIF